MVNAQIVIAVAVITAGGFVTRWLGFAAQGTSDTRILLGGYMLLLILSVFDLFGGIFSVVSGAIAMLAAFVTILTVVPWAEILAVVSGGSGQVTTPKPGDTGNGGQPATKKQGA